MSPSHAQAYFKRVLGIYQSRKSMVKRLTDQEKMYIIRECQKGTPESQVAKSRGYT